MVKLNRPLLLVLALAAGSAQAFSDQYQRRNELDSNIYRRDFDSQDITFTREDYEDLYGRDVYDDLEAREPVRGKFYSGGPKRPSRTKKRPSVRGPRSGSVPDPDNDKLMKEAIQFQNTFGVRDLDAEEPFGREYDQLDERDIFEDLD